MSTPGTESGQPVSRREFVERGAAGIAGAAVAGVAPRATAAAAARAVPTENPWRYDIDALRKVDPALVHFERFVRFPVELGSPRRLAVGPDGRLHVAAGRSVLIHSPEGGRVGEWKLEEPARCVRVSGDGRVWVGFRDHVEVYDGKGRRLARWGALGGKPFLTGIAFGGEDVYVADAGNRVVYRTDTDGRLQLRLGERDLGRHAPGLVLPSPFLDVEAGRDGSVLINNPGRHLVEIYTRDGERVRSWGRAGVAIDAFCGCCNPISLALLPDGRCVTAEKGLPRVKLFGPDGRLESVVAAPSDFAPVNSEERVTSSTADTVNDGLDVDVDATGRVWVLDLVGTTIHGYRRKTTEGKEA